MNLRKIDLNLLVIFDAVYVEKHVTRAAQKIGLSQPAVSNALTRLKHLLEDELFVRAANGLQATPRAQELAGSIHKILAELEHILDKEDFDPQTAKRTISIACVDFFEAIMLPPLAKFLNQNAPGITLRILPTSGKSFEYLDRGDVDFAIASFSQPPERFGHHVLAKTSYSSILRKSHPAAPRGNAPHELSLKDFAAARHILLSPRGETSGFVDAELAKLNLSRHVCLTITSFLSATPLLTDNDLIMTAPQTIIKKLVTNRELIEVPCPVMAPETFQALDLIWHRRLSDHPTNIWFTRVLQDIAQTAFNI